MQETDNNSENNEISNPVGAEASGSAMQIGGKALAVPAWFNKVESLTQTIADRAGCVLYDVDFVGQGKSKTLRVFIDKVDGAVGIEECTKVTNALNEVLDAQDVIPADHYNLEVSTPGVDRVLKKKWHFEKAIGKKIWIKTRQTFEACGVTDKKWAPAKQLDEVLEAIDGDKLVFKVKAVELRIPLEAIEKAHVVFVFPKGIKK